MMNRKYDPTELFDSTAPYYARYRAGYPEAFFSHLRDRFRLDGTQRVLDLGCGTGQIALPIAAHCAAVIAVDPQPAMLEQGRAAAATAGIANITWVEGSSLTLETLGVGTVDLVCMGQSFHWMDRPAVLAALEAIVAPGGGVVIASGPHPDEVTPPPWQAVIDAVRARYLGPERRAGSGTYTHPSERHREILARSPFAAVETNTWSQTVHRDLDQVIGLQLSYSYSSPALLGERQAAFAADLKAALKEANPSGDFTEDLDTESLIATRP
jgi:ubiquinone/menaquinone biosynthesis C-methylase UbiE